MKKAIAVSMVALVLLSATVFFAQPAAARSVSDCYSNYEECREEALDMDVSWFKMMLVLTMCDIALGRCILYPPA